jgi:SET domain-containing protein
MERTWKFNMDRKNGPEWLMYEDDKLVAYARRAKEAGWFVRISELNPTPNTEKIYIDDDVYPINFMNLMLEMHKKDTP